MYPQTHFIVAFFVGMILKKLGYIDLQMVLIAAAISVLLDLDHLLKYGLHHKNWSIVNAWNASVIHHELERTFIHYYIGFVVVSILIVLVAIFSIPIALIKATAYYSHFLLDHMHVYLRKTFKFKEFGLQFRITVQEILLDIIFILGIILLA